MGDRILKAIDSADGLEPVLIVRRPDDGHSYQRQWLSAELNNDPDSSILSGDSVVSDRVQVSCWDAPQRQIMATIRRAIRPQEETPSL